MQTQSLHPSSRSIGPCPESPTHGRSRDTPGGGGQAAVGPAACPVDVRWTGAPTGAREPRMGLCRAPQQHQAEPPSPRGLQAEGGQPRCWRTGESHTAMPPGDAHSLPCANDPKWPQPAQHSRPLHWPLGRTVTAGTSHTSMLHLQSLGPPPSTPGPSPATVGLCPSRPRHSTRSWPSKPCHRPHLWVPQAPLWGKARVNVGEGSGKSTLLLLASGSGADASTKGAQQAYFNIQGTAGRGWCPPPLVAGPPPGRPHPCPGEGAARRPRKQARRATASSSLTLLTEMPFDIGQSEGGTQKLASEASNPLSSQHPPCPRSSSPRSGKTRSRRTPGVPCAPGLTSTRLSPDGHRTATLQPHSTERNTLADPDPVGGG